MNGNETIQGIDVFQGLQISKQLIFLHQQQKVPVVLRGFTGDGDIGRAVGIGNVFGAAVKKRVQLLLREQGVNVAFGGVKLLALPVEQIQRRAFITSGILIDSK